MTERVLKRAALAAAAVALLGVGPGLAQEEDVSDQRYVMVVTISGHPFWVPIRKGAQDAADQLGVRETAHVLELIRGAKAEGLSIVLIMHNIEHVMQVAERAVVMRAGRRRGAVDIAGPGGEAAHDAIIRMLM